jgi:HPt (histidine-containing phosphotransfer) domain-containing protein
MNEQVQSMGAEMVSPMRDESMVARERLLARCMGKQELADKLVHLLVNGLPKDSSELQTALEAGDMERVAKVSHRLKGAAANMCADSLSRAAADLEQAAKNSHCTNVPDSWLTLQRQIDLVLKELAS